MEIGANVLLNRIEILFIRPATRKEKNLKSDLSFVPIWPTDERRTPCMSYKPLLLIAIIAWIIVHLLSSLMSDKNNNKMSVCAAGTVRLREPFIALCALVTY